MLPKLHSWSVRFVVFFLPPTFSLLRPPQLRVNPSHEQQVRALYSAKPVSRQDAQGIYPTLCKVKRRARVLLFLWQKGGQATLSACLTRCRTAQTAIESSLAGANIHHHDAELLSKRPQSRQVAALVTDAPARPALQRSISIDPSKQQIRRPRPVCFIWIRRGFFFFCHRAAHR